MALNLANASLLTSTFNINFGHVVSPMCESPQTHHLSLQQLTRERNHYYAVLHRILNVSLFSEVLKTYCKLFKSNTIILLSEPSSHNIQ